VIAAQRAGAVILDTRDPQEFASAHLVGSVNIGMTGRYAEFAGGVLQPGAPIVLVAEDGAELEAKNRLARIGFDNVVGFLPEPEAVMAANPAEVRQGKRVDVTAMKAMMGSTEDLQLVDVRQPGETEGGIVDGAIVIPLTQLNQKLSSLDASKPTLVYCAGGFRSSIAASRMMASGFADVTDLLGGYGAWAAANASEGAPA
jgi:rhodanese-related sulfurtransferase